jgi:hypothetical protein
MIKHRGKQTSQAKVAKAEAFAALVVVDNLNDAVDS